MAKYGNETSTDMQEAFRLPPGLHHRSRTPPETYLRTPPELHKKFYPQPEAGSLNPAASLSAETIKKTLKLPTNNSLTNGEPGLVPTSDDKLLREIHKEAQQSNLYQDPYPLTTIEQDNTNPPTFASMIWTSIKEDRKGIPRRAWPKVKRFKAPIRVIPKPSDEMTPDELFEHLNPQARRPAVPAAVRKAARAENRAPASQLHKNPSSKCAVLRTSRADLRLNTNAANVAHEWKPPSALDPGLAFQAPAAGRYQGQENYPNTMANSGIFPPNIQIEGLPNHPSIHMITGDQSGFRIEPRSGFFFSPDPVQERAAMAAHYALPAPPYTQYPGDVYSVSTGTETGHVQYPGNAYQAGAVTSPTRSQATNPPHPKADTTNSVLRENLHQHTQAEPKGPSRYYPNSQLPASRHRLPNAPNKFHSSTAASYDGTLSNHTAYNGNSSGSTNTNNQLHQSNHLLNSTRGVFIRNIPKDVSLGQVCANIRGGAVDFIYFQKNDGKLDAGIMFVLAESARTYKHWTNKVGGIWWDPLQHHESYPSFTAFIGPQCGGHDRLNDRVRDAVSGEGATRCLLFVGLPNDMTQDQLLKTICQKMPLLPLDIESLQIITHKDVGKGEGKNTTVLKLCSIAKALDLKQIFSDDKVYKGVRVYFAADECAGSIKDLVDRQSQVMSEGSHGSSRHRRIQVHYTRR